MNWPWSKPTAKLPERDLDEIKGLCKIIFVDDKAYPVIDILKRAGWTNTRRLADVNSLDQHEVKEAHILFIDIQGVGKKLKFKDEGLGLIVALKEKYPSKKVVAYSSEDQGQVQAFSTGINVADYRLHKTADPYEFQFLIERLAKDAFSLTECIARLQQEILKQYGTAYETDHIIKALKKVNSRKDFSMQAISKSFGLQDAGSIASIVQVFLTGA